MKLSIFQLSVLYGVLWPYRRQYSGNSIVWYDSANQQVTAIHKTDNIQEAYCPMSILLHQSCVIQATDNIYFKIYFKSVKPILFVLSQLDLAYIWGCKITVNICWENKTVYVTIYFSVHTWYFVKSYGQVWKFRQQLENENSIVCRQQSQ